MHYFGSLRCWDDLFFLVSCNSNSLWCFYQILRIFKVNLEGEQFKKPSKISGEFWLSSRFRSIQKAPLCAQRPVPSQGHHNGAVTQVLQVWATLRLPAVRLRESKCTKSWWWFHPYFLEFSPRKIWETLRLDSYFDEHIFQRGWWKTTNQTKSWCVFSPPCVFFDTPSRYFVNVC